MDEYSIPNTNRVLSLPSYSSYFSEGHMFEQTQFRVNIDLFAQNAMGLSKGHMKGVPGKRLDKT